MIYAEAYERIEGAFGAPVLLTCEHASERLPDEWRWPAADVRLRGSHWAYDPGARDIVHELAAALDCAAVLSRFTRLLADPNRETDHADLFRTRADGEDIALNAEISQADAARRRAHYYDAYHAAVDAAVAEHEAPVLLSVHTFAPVYEGQRRDVEVGVLFNRDEVLGVELLRHLSGCLANVAENQPWSGKEGLIYAVERHADRHGRQAVELEVRQDLATDPTYRKRLVSAVVRFFGE